MGNKKETNLLLKLASRKQNHNLFNSFNRQYVSIDSTLLMCFLKKMAT